MLAKTRLTGRGLTVACIVSAALGQIAVADAEVVGESFTGTVTAGTGNITPGQTASGYFVYDTSQLYDLGNSGYNYSTMLPAPNPGSAQSGGVVVSTTAGGSTYTVQSGGSANTSNITIGNVITTYLDANAGLNVYSQNYNRASGLYSPVAEVSLLFNGGPVFGPPPSGSTLYAQQLALGAFNYYNTSNPVSFSGNINSVSPLPGLSANNPIGPGGTPFGANCNGTGGLIQCGGGLLAALGIGLFFDPTVAAGYDLKVVSGGTFQSVGAAPTSVVPNPNPYTLTAAGATLGTLAPGAQYTFGQGGVSEFDITGIDPSLGLDPNNPLAFPIQLSFDPNGDPIVFDMVPLTADGTPVSGSGSTGSGTGIGGGTGTQVPEPESIYLLGAMLPMLLLLSSRKRQRSV